MPPPEEPQLTPSQSTLPRWRLIQNHLSSSVSLLAQTVGWDGVQMLLHAFNVFLYYISNDSFFLVIWVVRLF